MGIRSSKAVWVITACTVIAAAGLSVFFWQIGLDKAVAYSGIVIAVLSVLILGGTLILVLRDDRSTENSKPNAISEAASVPTPKPVSVKQQAKKGGRNYYAGRDLTVGSEKESESD